MKKLNRLALTAFMLSALLAVSGCDSRVRSYEVNGYIKMCAEKGGIYEINNFFSNAKCNDGDIVHWKN